MNERKREIEGWEGRERVNGLDGTLANRDMATIRETDFCFGMTAILQT